MIHISGISDEAGKPIDVQIKAHKQLGWKHIELRCIDGVNLTGVSDEVFENVYAKVSESGLIVSGFASALGNWSKPITGDFQVDVDELTTAIPRMKKFGTNLIRTMSWPNDKDAPLEIEAWRDQVCRRLKVLCKMAQDADIIIAHENCSGWGGLGPSESLELLERIASPALTLLWDTGNPTTHEGQDSWEYYNAVKDKITYVHIKDGVSNPDGTTRFTWPGEGHGAVLKTLVDLIERGYDGFVSIEPHVAAIIHEAKAADSTEAAYNSYLEYGRKLMVLAEQAEKMANKAASD